MEIKNGLYFRKANAKPIVVPSYSVETNFAVSEEQAERELIKRCICPELPDNHHIYLKMHDLPDSLYESKEYTMGSTVWKIRKDRIDPPAQFLSYAQGRYSNRQLIEWLYIFPSIINSTRRKHVRQADFGNYQRKHRQ